MRTEREREWIWIVPTREDHSGKHLAFPTVTILGSFKTSWERKKVGGEWVGVASGKGETPGRHGRVRGLKLELSRAGVGGNGGILSLTKKSEKMALDFLCTMSDVHMVKHWSLYIYYTMRVLNWGLLSFSNSRTETWYGDKAYINQLLSPSRYKALEAHGCKPWTNNLLIVPHTLGTLTANIT